MKNLKNKIAASLVVLVLAAVVFISCDTLMEDLSYIPVLTGITATTAKKDYHIGDELDLTKITVTANYDYGPSKTLASTDYSVTGFNSTAYVDDEEITVTYNGKTATFKINVVFNWYETPKQLPAGTDGTYGTEGTYVYFGVWPQDEVRAANEAALALDENAATTIERGNFKYVKGSDCEYYVKYGNKWYKVMPVKWRVADNAYKDASGTSKGKLLLAESILTSNIPYYDNDNHRTINGKTVYANNYMHSQIRAFLNGISYQGESAKQTQWNNKGFLQTAFTNDAIDSIITTKVDNAKEQMSYDGISGMNEDYACSATDDKIFLLSEKEVVQYSKEAYDEWGEGNSRSNSRIRVITDFAKANGAKVQEIEGVWWLRSPDCTDSTAAAVVWGDGDASITNGVDFKDCGVVPALVISF